MGQRVDQGLDLLAQGLLIRVKLAATDEDNRLQVLLLIALFEISESTSYLGP